MADATLIEIKTNNLSERERTYQWLKSLKGSNRPIFVFKVKGQTRLIAATQTEEEDAELVDQNALPVLYNTPSLNNRQVNVGLPPGQGRWYWVSFTTPGDGVLDFWGKLSETCWRQWKNNIPHVQPPPCFNDAKIFKVTGNNQIHLFIRALNNKTIDDIMSDFPVPCSPAGHYQTVTNVTVRVLVE